MAILSLSSFMNPVSYNRPCSSKLMINPSSSSSSYICSSSISSSRNHHQVAQIGQSNNYNNITRTKCELKESAGSSSGSGSNNVVLGIGSPIIVIEAPKMLKTAASVPCLRANSGLVKPGDVGRIVSRKPKDVWAVRLSIGTYLIDGRYFKPLDLDL